MKICSRRKLEKNLDCFQIRTASKDGYTAACKECLSIYDKNRPNHKERVAQCQERYKNKRASGDIEFIEADRKRMRDYRKSNPNKYKAQCMVSNYIRDGKLIRPNQCSCCQKECKPQAHHWSYKKKKGGALARCCLVMYKMSC